MHSQRARLDASIKPKTPAKRRRRVEGDRGMHSDFASGRDSGEDIICQDCSSGLRASKMLLCDACDDGWHLDCLTSPLEDVPEGLWLCDACVHCSSHSHGHAPGDVGKGGSTSTAADAMAVAPSSGGEETWNTSGFSGTRNPHPWPPKLPSHPRTTHAPTFIRSRNCNACMLACIHVCMHICAQHTDQGFHAAATTSTFTPPPPIPAPQADDRKGTLPTTGFLPGGAHQFAAFCMAVFTLASRSPSSLQSRCRPPSVS